MTDHKIGSLEEEALKRKGRLANLKKQKDEANEKVAEELANLPKPRFRSYKPQDDSLKENILQEPRPGDVESEIQDQLEAARAKVLAEELDLGSLAPRKPDWDLKRDVAKKLDKLERRAQKAIAELIIDRLKQDHDDLAAAVSMEGNINQKTTS